MQERKISHILEYVLDSNLAAIAFGRNVIEPRRCKLYRNKCKIQRIQSVDLLPEQKDVSDMGGSLQIGS